MTQNSKTYTVSEYGYIGKDAYVENYNTKYISKKVPSTVFKELEAFAKSDKGKDVLGFAKNGLYLQAKNYVGVIQTKSGYTLEIVPKIYSKSKKETNEAIVKAVFVQLLKILYKLPSYKHVGNANFEIDKKPLLEIFISMFLQEVAKIIKRGLKSDYITKEENEKFLKGKLLTSCHLKYNYIHKERFYVEYDEYSTNRVENRLIKSTLLYLLKVSSSIDNIRLIRQYLEHMHFIELSINYDADFRKVVTNTRGMEIYKNALIWAKIFLKKETFDSFSGETIAFAILYPMEKLFENYVEHYLLQRYDRIKDITIKSQVSKSFVKQKNGAILFNIRPDFIIKSKENNLVVADAKWKIITQDFSFSQSDFYQLYTYAKIFNPIAKKALRLYYPMSEDFTQIRSFEYLEDAKINTKIITIPLDMTKILEV